MDERAVHLHVVPLAADADRERAARALLTAAERERADTIRRPDARRRSTLARAALRTLLAELTGETPERVALVHEAGGKPVLAGGRNITFNVSHTGDVAVIALARHVPVGVDVEGPVAPERARRIARAFFDPDEAARVGELDPDGQARAFLRGWTAREAVAKALGRPLRECLRATRFDLASQSPLALTATPDGAPPPHEWSLHELALAPGREAVAVAVPRPGVPVTVTAFQG
jgi:4'-phosphopantetheinyl transferase